jgi:phosphatidylserine/phosphatidylglycerophosphate/cardiolipin synthase-like enzyme
MDHRSVVGVRTAPAPEAPVPFYPIVRPSLSVTRQVALCLALVLTAGVVATTAPATAAPPAQRGDTPAGTDHTDRAESGIVAVYPNPVTDGDVGEYVTLSVPPDTRLGAYTLADDEAAVSLPNTTVGGRVVLSTAPNATEQLVDGSVYALSDGLQLANGGEPLVLRRNGTVVDRLNYTDAPEGERRVRDESERWRPLGATDRPVVTGDAGEVRVFTLPDAPAVATDTLARADRRILFAGYTLTDGAVADQLVAATDRNVSVRVLVDGDPVGGMARPQAEILDELAAAGIDVRVLGGDHARYEFHHAKYAVVDDSALVTTENWKHAGLGGNGSRGWGVVTEQPRVVRGLADTFRADAGWRDARPWAEYRAGKSFESAPSANATYPTQFRPRTLPVAQTHLLVAPDNAESRLLDILANATDTIAVEQVSVGGRQQPFVRATLAAARRGVEVRILLSSAWYVEEENHRLAAWLNEHASREGLPLEASLADPRGDFEKIHAKGVVVDGDQVVLGSLNWNNNSARKNREVVLVLEGEAVGRYYGRVFDADWPVPPPVPAGVAVVVLLASLFAVRVGARLEFESPPG